MTMVNVIMRMLRVRHGHGHTHDGGDGDGHGDRHTDAAGEEMLRCNDVHDDGNTKDAADPFLCFNNTNCIWKMPYMRKSVALKDESP